MAIDAFLKLGDIDGESRDAEYSKWIDVLAWSWGASQSGTMHLAGGGGGGKTNVENLSVTKYVDSASTNLWTKCFTGKHYPQATLKLRKAGENPLVYLTIEMTDVIISNLSTGGSGGEDRLTENVSMNFAKVNLTYTPQDAKGAGSGAMVAGFDISANTPM